MQPDPQDLEIPTPTLLVIGNFDGVHLGHQSLVHHVVSQSAASGLKPVVMTFDPHPSLVLGHAPKGKLSGLARKVELLKQLSSSLDVRVEHFDLSLAHMSPQTFAKEVLVRRHGARHVVVGANFRFGHQRKGDLAALCELGAALGFAVQAAPLLEAAGAPVSSSRVRCAVSEGDLKAASELLGRPHTLRGVVSLGRQLGRTLGFPTANLAQVEEMLPPNGVYACWAKLSAESQLRPAVVNIGTRPTVDGGAVSVEAHLLDFSQDLYGQELDLQLVSGLRPERRFDGLQALSAQIRQDVASARQILRA